MADNIEKTEKVEMAKAYNYRGDNQTGIGGVQVGGFECNGLP